MSSNKKHNPVCKEHHKNITLITEVIKDGAKFDNQGHIVNPPPLLGYNPYSCVGEGSECYAGEQFDVISENLVPVIGICRNEMCIRIN